MVCKKCGKENPEGVRFCAGCGSIMEASAASVETAYGANGAYTAPAGENAGAPVGAYATAPSGESFVDKAKALWAKREVKLGVAIVAAIIVILLVFGSCGGGASSPEDAAENFVIARLEGDVDAYIDCLPPQIAENLEDAYDKYEKDKMDEIREEAKDEAVEDYEIKKIKKEKMDKDERKSYESNLSQSAASYAASVDFDEDDIKDMSMKEMREIQEEYEEDYEVEIEEAYYVTVEGKADGEDFEKTIPVGEIDGDWYVLKTGF
ncbi:MAG: zinc ribbon domain-containing protein [Oscillospiraceae bacterium]|nr:zinc ribbon domain-containing protein [Oscillospiraceae bacterium]